MSGVMAESHAGKAKAIPGFINTSGSCSVSPPIRAILLLE